MPPRDDRWMMGVALGAAMIVLGLFFVGGAALIWRATATDLVALPSLPVLNVAAMMADLGWRFWGR